MAVDMGSAIAYLLLDTTNFNTGLQGAQNGLVSAGVAMSSAGATMTATVTRGLVNVGKTAVNEAANFESAMSQVRATMLKSAEDFNNEVGTVTLGSGENLREFIGNLTDFALEMASTTKFTASETAAALNYMALAGYDTQESMEMLPNVLNLAAAGAMDLALASDMVTDTQTAFGLSAERTRQMVDEMAKAASTGNTNVQQLGEAFLTVGGLTKNLNGGLVTLSDGTTTAVDGVQELEIALTAMANAGIKGGEAGTHMRNVLLKLASPTSEGAKQFKRLGVDAFDAEGNMKSLSTIFGDLGDSLGKLSQQEKLQAVSDIFNVRDTATVEALLSAVEGDWNEIGESILGAEGAAEDMAEIQLDNLNGQITKLKSGLQVLAIQFGELMLPALKEVVGYVQRLTTWLSSLDEGQKKVVMRIALIVAAIGPVLLILGRLVALVGSASKGFALLTQGITAGGALGAAAIVGLVAVFAKLYATNENFRNSINETFTKLKDGVLSFIESFKPSFDSLIESVNGFIDALAKPLSSLFDTISTKFVEALNLIQPIIDGIISGFSEFLDIMSPIVADIIQSISDLIANIDLTGIISSIEEALSGLEKALSPVIDAVTSYITEGQLASDVSSVLDTAVSLLSTTINTLANGVVSAINGVTSFVTWLNEGSTGAEAFKTVVIALAAAIGGYAASVAIINGLQGVWAAVTNGVTIAQAALNAVMMANPIALVIAGITALVAAFVYLWNTSEDFRNFWINLWNKVKSIASNVITAISEAFESLKTTISKFVSSASAFITNFVNKVKEFFTVKIPSAIDAAIEWFENLPYNIGVALGSAVAAVVDFATSVWNNMQTEIPNAIDAAVEFFAELPGKIATWLTEAVGKVTDWGSEVYDEMSSTVSDAITAVGDWLAELPGKFSDWFDEVIATLSGIDLSSVGSEILDSLWSGLQATWDSIKGWFDSLSLNWNKFTSGFKKGFSGGSYATGLDYVPRTMNVTVHRGERILTQQENEQFSKGGSVEVVTYQNDEAINKLSDTMNKLLSEVKELKDKQIVLDSKRLVGGLVGEMDRQLGIRAERARGVV